MWADPVTQSVRGTFVDAVQRQPTPVARRRDALTSRERLVVAGSAATPVVVVMLVLGAIAIGGPASAGDVLVAGIVYGGLLGAAAGFVAVDRLHARQCPRCGTRNLRGTVGCEDCAYDLVRRPRYACTERHAAYLDPGLCDCGRRLTELPVVRGIGREIGFILRAGAWVLAFLLLIGFALQFLAQ